MSTSSLVDEDEKVDLAYSAAWDSLRHEQELHLQKMMYDHPEFASALGKNDWARDSWFEGFRPAKWFRAATDPTLYFHADPEISDETYQRDVASVGLQKEQVYERMDPGARLANVQDRMIYVQRILKKYHFLITATRGGAEPAYRAYMVRQMRTVAERWEHA